MAGRSNPAPEEMAAIFNKVYDEALSLGLSMTEAHDRAHAAVLQELEPTIQDADYKRGGP